LSIFGNAISEYGRPFEIRVDKGTESVLIVFDQHLVGLQAITG